MGISHPPNIILPRTNREGAQRFHLRYRLSPRDSKFSQSWGIWIKKTGWYFVGCLWILKMWCLLCICINACLSFLINSPSTINFSAFFLLLSFGQYGRDTEVASSSCLAISPRCGTFCRPIAADVWTEQAAPNQTGCVDRPQFRISTHTHTHTHPPGMATRLTLQQQQRTLNSIEEKTVPRRRHDKWNHCAPWTHAHFIIVAHWRSCTVILNIHQEQWPT